MKSFEEPRQDAIKRTLEGGLNPTTQDNASNYLYYVRKTNAGHGYDGIV
jgi:hypothetical protein